MKYVAVSHREDMWDVLYESHSWRLFFCTARWWLLQTKYKPSFRFRLRVVIHAAITRIKRPPIWKTTNS